MGSTTATKRFRYPEGNSDPAADTDIANLITDFDIEINSQMANRREKLRHRPVGVMQSSVDYSQPAAGYVNLPVGTVMLNQGSVCDAANNRFLISATAGAGVYYVSGYAHVFVPGGTATRAFLEIDKGGATYVARQSRAAWGQHFQASAMISLAVGETLNLRGYRDGTATSTWSQAWFYLYKLTD